MERCSSRRAFSSPLLYKTYGDLNHAPRCTSTHSQIRQFNSLCCCFTFGYHETDWCVMDGLRSQPIAPISHGRPKGGGGPLKKAASKMIMSESLTKKRLLKNSVYRDKRWVDPRGTLPLDPMLKQALWTFLIQQKLLVPSGRKSKNMVTTVTFSSLRVAVSLGKTFCSASNLMHHSLTLRFQVCTQ